MNKQYLILDFDECLFEHPDKDFLLKLEECFARGAIAHGFRHGDEEETLAKAIEISRAAYETVGESYTAFEEYGIRPEDVFNGGYDYFLENFLPPYIDKIKDTGSEYARYLEDPRFEIAILTHGSTQYASVILEYLGLGGLIPQERIIGLDKTDLALKSTSKRGFEEALKQMGLDPAEVESERPDNVFFADDAARNLKIPHEVGIRTIHIGENIHQTANQDEYPYVNFRFKRLLEFFQTYDEPGSRVSLGRAYSL